MSLIKSCSRSRSYEIKKNTSPSSIGRSMDRKYAEDNSRSGSREMYLRKKRKISKDRSRSRSMGRQGHRAYKYQRRQSRSNSPYEQRNDRRYSRSPYGDRRRYIGTREKPKKSRCLGVFGLNMYTTKDQIMHIFSKYGTIEHVQVVVDAYTGRSRGFCFVYFDRTEDATVARHYCTGMEIDNRRIRVDYSITFRPYEPTPGSYYEKDPDDHCRLSPLPYYRERRRRYDRSSTRSYSRERK